MEKIKRVGMILISVLTLIIVASLIFVININLTSSEKQTFNDDSEHLTEEEIISLIELINVYDSYLITFDGTKDLKKKYFGPNITFHPVNSTCYLNDGDYLIYDESTKMYKADSDYHAHGAYTPPSIENYYVEGKRIVDGDKLIYTITLKKAFAYPNSSLYYGSYTDLVNNTNLVVNLYEEYGNYEQEEISSLLEDYKDEFTSYTYVLETKDSLNNSYLVELANLKSQSEF